MSYPARAEGLVNMITNNSIKHQSFVYTQVNAETVLFQAIQLSISHLFAPSLNVKQFYLPYQALPLRVGVDLGVIAMKGYSAFAKAPVVLEPHCQRKPSGRQLTYLHTVIWFQETNNDNP